MSTRVWFQLVPHGRVTSMQKPEDVADWDIDAFVAALKAKEELKPKLDRVSVDDIYVYPHTTTVPIPGHAVAYNGWDEVPSTDPLPGEIVPRYLIVQEKGEKRSGATISLLENGLPEMTMSGSRTDGSKSKDHEPAKCIVKSFALIDQQWRHVNSALYTTMTNQNLTRLNYASESDVQGHVKNLLSDIIGTAGLESVQCLNELSIFGHRADIWLIACAGKPVGVVEIKKPGTDILLHNNVLGQLYNYMLRLKSFFGVRHVFGIVTTYQEWRICWLEGADNEASIEKTTAKLKYREMFGTVVLQYDHQDLVRILCSVLVRMASSPSDPVQLIDPDRPYIVADEASWRWSTHIFPNNFTEDMLHHAGIPTVDKRGLIFLDDFGAGADGRAWRACNHKGHGCVVKFAESEETLEIELQNWTALNGIGTAKIIQLNSQKALLMPYLRPADPKNKEEVKQVQDMVQRVSEEGYVHRDLGWRHVGFHSPPPKSKTRPEPVMFDLVQLEKTDDQRRALQDMFDQLGLTED